MANSLRDIAEITENDSTDDASRIDELVSLDGLFSQLAQETGSKKLSIDEFDKIHQEIQNLPKIESNLEKQFEDAELLKKTLPDTVIKVDDPVTNPLTKADRQKQREEDAGKEWFNMKKKELTPELKRDMLVIKNRAVLDRKRHYKKDKWEIPKYFHTGTIIEGNTEYFSARLAKKNRGRSLAEEILNDDESKTYFRRKYHEIQTQKTSGGKKHYKKLKEKRRGY